jgi:hypothetical protein
MSLSQSPLLDNTQHSQEIRTHNLSRRVVPNRRLRSRGHWERLSLVSVWSSPEGWMAHICNAGEEWEFFKIVVGCFSKRRKANCICCILRRKCLLKDVIEGRIESTGKRGRRRKHKCAFSRLSITRNKLLVNVFLANSFGLKIKPLSGHHTRMKCSCVVSWWWLDLQAETIRQENVYK